MMCHFRLAPLVALLTLVIASPCVSQAEDRLVPETEAQRPFLFTNLSLAAAERAAIAISPEIAGADARLTASRYALAAAREGIAPSFVSSYAQTPQGNPPGPAVISRQAVAGLQLTIADFVAYAPAVREAALLLAASEADRATALAAERIRVVGLYFDALKARALVSARGDALAFAVSQYRASQTRAKAGDAPQLDVLRADVEVAKATAERELATAADVNATESLGAETGAGEGVFDAVAAANLPDVSPQSTDPEKAVERARLARPELRSAALALEAARTAIRSARAAGFPAVTVSGGYLVGTDSGVPVYAPTINAQVSIPLGSANRSRIAVAVAKVVEAQAKTVVVERQVALDVGASARTLGASLRALAGMARARQSAEAEVRATELGYRNGASSSLELTSARAMYSQAVIDELAARYDVEKARATLDIEVGN